MQRIEILRATIACLFLLLVGCSDDTDDLFVVYVHPDRSIAAGLKSGKIACMRCPKFFQFEIARNELQQLLATHGLAEVAVLNEHMEAVVGLPEAQWWPERWEISAMQKFWIELPQLYPEEAPPFRLALVKGERVYFMTTQRAPEPSS